MRSIFIGSTGGEPGQTLATWALAIRLREKGFGWVSSNPTACFRRREPLPPGEAVIPMSSS